MNRGRDSAVARIAVGCQQSRSLISGESWVAGLGEAGTISDRVYMSENTTGENLALISLLELSRVRSVEIRTDPAYWQRLGIDADPVESDSRLPGLCRSTSVYQNDQRGLRSSSVEFVRP